MLKVGLTQSSRLLHPFSQPDGSDDRDLPPQCTFPLDPFSEQYHEKLRDGPRLDSDEYSHVDPEILAEFDSSLRTYPDVSMELSTTLTLAIPPLATSHHTRCHPLSSRQCVVRLTTCYDKISFNPQSPLAVLQRYLYAARIYMVNHNHPDLWSIIMRLIQSLRVMAFLFLKSLISWTGLVEAKHLPN